MTVIDSRRAGLVDAESVRARIEHLDRLLVELDDLRELARFAERTIEESTAADGI